MGKASLPVAYYFTKGECIRWNKIALIFLLMYETKVSFYVFINQFLMEWKCFGRMIPQISRPSLSMQIVKKSPRKTRFFPMLDLSYIYNVFHAVNRELAALEINYRQEVTVFFRNAVYAKTLNVADESHLFFWFRYNGLVE